VSRSWIDRARRRFATDASAGLVIGRDYVGFAHVVAAGGGWQARLVSEKRLATPLFSGAPSQQASAALAEALKIVPAALKRSYLPLHVSLSDAAVRVATFELDQMPKGHAAQLDLVRLRFARLGLNGVHVFACQPLAREGDKQLLFGMAGDDAWQRRVGEALAQAGIVAWSFSANACRQFNCYNERLARASGALVALAPDACSLWIWDAEGRPRYARSQWRGGRGDHAEIAAEVERLIVAYVHGGPRRTVTQVFVVGGDETGAMAAALDARLRAPCAKLAPADSGVQSAGAAASAALSLAAALER
jgi:hypothetical protein